MSKGRASHDLPLASTDETLAFWVPCEISCLSTKGPITAIATRSNVGSYPRLPCGTQV